MIIIALGSNMSGAYGSPVAALNKALRLLESHGVHLVRCSQWYRSRAQGLPQADFFNGVVVVTSALAPEALLLRLSSIERQFGYRSVSGGPRVLDLDLVDYHRQIKGYGRWGRWGIPRESVRVLSLPHPEMHRRAFVLQPLMDIAPEWRHPVSGLSPEDLLAGLFPR
ncbi:MAG: 2-amino-4-hydroxy-6-hydroxymethyldihydropteridine diphosphokinase [Parvularculales bacterium]